MRPYTIAISVALILAVLTAAWLVSPYQLLWLVVLLPLTGLVLYDATQTSDNVARNYPLVGRFKKLLVSNRDLIQDWVIESNWNGRPFNWIERNIVYSRANKWVMTAPFGTQFDYYHEGYEWLLHSTAPSRSKIEGDLRVVVGGKDCSQPYSCSLLNVSGMSFGSISDNAVMALNGGAQLGGFAHNTGEGGLTKYHLHYGGDLIFQFGTGYFGCRTPDGGFDEKKFADVAAHPTVKMIEMKISQGAKPGYGAILPGRKVTPEVAEIRGLKPRQTVLSPPAHQTFSTPIELMYFVKRLRELSGGKPVGYKFCLGQPHEFLSMCQAMIKTGICPDFITIDGGEGGTAAAHYESMHWVGMPVEDALVYVVDALIAFDLKKEVKVFAAGKVSSAFHLARLLALGADACYSARAMMFALGCVQALQCNLDTCPTGVTATRASLAKGLVPENKKHKVYNFHYNTIAGLKEMLECAGLRDASDLNRRHLCRRTSHLNINTLDEVFPYAQPGSLLMAPYPERWQKDMALANPERF